MDELIERLQSVLSELWKRIWHPGVVITYKTQGFIYKYEVLLRLHCEDGPAITYPEDGTKCYFWHGKRHRTNGPAVEFVSGDGKYFIGGVEMTKEAYEARDKSKDWDAFKKEES